MIAFMFQFHQARNTAAQNCVLALPRPLEGRLSFPKKAHAWLSKENNGQDEKHMAANGRSAKEND